MLIRSRLRITTFISIGTSVVVGVILVVSGIDLNKKINSDLFLQSVVRETVQLQSNTYEYLIHHEQRMYVQWRGRHEKVGGMLNTMNFISGENSELRDDIRRNHESIGAIFTSLSTAIKEGGPAHRHEPDRGLSNEREAILGGQLLLKSQEMISGSLRLARANHKEMVAAQKTTAIVFILSLAFLVIVVTTASSTIARSLVKPIEKLRDGTGIVGSGNLDHRIGTDRDDEIGQLSRSFDQMARKLKATTVSRDELEAEVSERRKAEEEIRRLNEELEQRVRDRTEKLEAINKGLEAFSHSVSHDLRAPLRHVSGFVELLKRSASGRLGEKDVHYLKMISDSTEKMGTLIDDLLSFSRMGRAELRKTSVDMGAIVAEIVREFREETGGRDIRWQVGPLPAVYGDPAMLRQAVANLVSNAVKFTRHKQEARIEIGCGARDGKEVAFFVRDNGVGFDMKYADKLFGVFQRLHSSVEFDGTGIGLANVRRIVHRHGGNTWAEGAIDGGATFHFSIPKDRERG